MSFYDTPPTRRLCLVRGCSNLALALGIFALSFVMPEMDQAGRIFFYLIIGYFLIVSLVNFRRARLTPPGEIEMNLDLAPVPVQVRSYRRALIILVIAFSVLSVATVYNLNLLESDVHRSAEVEVWAPVSFVYEYLGYWPAVLLAPLLGIVCCGVCLAKLRGLSSAPTEKIRPGPSNL